MSESTQHKLSRIRPPRVQITYDVETGGAIEMKELPLVVGILADLSGKPENPLPYLKKRKFVEIDRDNFNEVMEKLAPRLAFQVPNRLNGESSDALKVELKFKNFGDFHPAAVVEQVESLRKIFEARNRLRDLLAKLDGNDDLDGLLQEVATNTESQQQLAEQTGRKAEGGESNG
ncbi:MAG TPA: type VI secretion system contractile sheath small subunit [Thermoanaerobaculia bacterium]|nr:type VI secretion system contractile sheath small subunit [Thermoanaerobaculia bacterium]